MEDCRVTEKGKEGDPVSPKRKGGSKEVVLTRLGHAAEQPPPRKDTVKSRQRMMMMVMTVVGGLGLHVEVYGRVQGPVQTKLN